MTIDCHALVASSDIARYPIAEGVPALKPGELEDFPQAETLLDCVGDKLSGAVLVQRGRFYGNDNSLICDLAAENPSLRALCSVETREGGCGRIAGELLARRNVSGLRFMEPEKGADISWLAGENARHAWNALAAKGAIADVHFFPWNRAEGLEALAGLLRDYPEVPVLIDNLASCGIEQGAPDFGVDAAVSEIAEHGHVALKFSAMTLGRANKEELEINELLGRFIALLGAERIVWGTDIIAPGTTILAANEQAQNALSALDEMTRHALLHGNAAQLFGF